MSNLTAADKALVVDLFGIAEFQVDQFVANVRRIFGGGEGSASTDSASVEKAVNDALGSKLDDITARLDKLEAGEGSDGTALSELKSEVDALRNDHDKQAAAFKALAAGSGTAIGDTSGSAGPGPSSGAAGAIDKIDTGPSSGATLGSTGDQPDATKAL